MRLHVVVRGQVQGVGFRWFVREAARGLGLAGWVRNRADGTVEVAADGDALAIAKLRQSLDEGPSRARVTSVDDVASADAIDSERHDVTRLERPFSILR